MLVHDDFSALGVAELFGQFNGIGKPAGLVGEFQFNGAGSAEDAAIGGEIADLWVRNAARFENHIFEPGIIFIDHALHDLPRFGSQVFIRRAHVFEGSAFDGIGADSELEEGVFEIEGVEDHADASDDGRRADDNFVGAAGDIIRAAGHDFLSRGDDGLVRLVRNLSSA